MVESLVLGLNFLGTKAIIVYVVAIVAIVAISLYMRRGSMSR